jgi:hypothetical protein
LAFLGAFVTAVEVLPEDKPAAFLRGALMYQRLVTRAIAPNPINPPIRNTRFLRERVLALGVFRKASGISFIESDDLSGFPENSALATGKLLHFLYSSLANCKLETNQGTQKNYGTVSSKQNNWKPDLKTS